MSSCADIKSSLCTELGLSGQWPAEQVLQLDWAAVVPALESHLHASNS